MIYGLQMAASLDDLFADPSYVSDDEAALRCGSAWARDEEDRRLASKYAAALIIFNFAWNAYEAAIEISAGDSLAKDKTPVRGRKLFQAEAKEASRIAALPVSFRGARHVCGSDASLKTELAKIETK